MHPLLWIIVMISLIETNAETDTKKNPVLNDELRRLLDPDSARRSSSTRRPVPSQPPVRDSESEEDNDSESELEQEYPCAGNGGTGSEDDEQENSEAQQEDEDQEYEAPEEFDWEKETNRPVAHGRPSWMTWGGHRRPPYPGWWNMHGYAK
ncbi:unnamed protein product [Echinostoma caproni]|uniref:Secreted phosphoprotein 1 n=1 Tax=Echinostoma caproni TaxID=27848 RepID=A0A183B6I4_9TREM|nr:unnamed protein product [Echinostoma caproni]